MEEALKARLLDTAAVTALVGARVNWVMRAQGSALPAVVLTVVGGAEGVHLKGPDGLFQGRVQADCWAADHAGAKALARAVLASLHGYRGGSFRAVIHDATREMREGGTNEAERLFRVSLDFIVNWRTL